MSITEATESLRVARIAARFGIELPQPVVDAQQYFDVVKAATATPADLPEDTAENVAQLIQIQAQAEASKAYLEPLRRKYTSAARTKLRFAWAEHGASLLEPFGTIYDQTTARLAGALAGLDRADAQHVSAIREDIEAVSQLIQVRCLIEDGLIDESRRWWVAFFTIDSLKSFQVLSSRLSLASSNSVRLQYTAVEWWSAVLRGDQATPKWNLDVQAELDRLARGGSLGGDQLVGDQYGISTTAGAMTFGEKVG